MRPKAMTVPVIVAGLLPQSRGSRPTESTQARTSRVRRSTDCWSDTAGARSCRDPGIRKQTKRPSPPLKKLRRTVRQEVFRQAERGRRLRLMLQDEVAQRHADEFVLMVMDQAGWLLAGELVVPQHMRLLMLPPCSPELNPAEHLWEAIREDCFANHVFADLDAVVSAFTTGLCDLEADPCQTRSMTGFGWINSIFSNATW